MNKEEILLKLNNAKIVKINLASISSMSKSVDSLYNDLKRGQVELAKAANSAESIFKSASLKNKYLEDSIKEAQQQVKELGIDEPSELKQIKSSNSKIETTLKRYLKMASDAANI